MFGYLNQKIADFNKTLPAGRRKIEVYFGTAEGTPRTRNDYESLISVALSQKNGQKMNIQKLNADGLTDAQIEEAKIVNEILDKNKINYYFQPIINVRNGEIYAYEALMRVDTQPIIQPLVVVKYAGLFNRLYDIEYTTFNNVLDFINMHAASIKSDAKIFINSIPGQRMKSKDMKEIAEKAKTFAGRLVVELTEQSEIDEKELTLLKNDYIKAGFETAVDDYGSGYSNVSNLLRYMPNYVKIDRALLANIQDSPQKQHFVKDIIEFSHDNNILALAEGVETAEEVETVIQLGIDLIQGFYIARPSAKIIKEIPEAVKEEIVRYCMSRGNNHTKRDYIAGREEMISLPVLSNEGYKTEHYCESVRASYTDHCLCESFDRVVSVFFVVVIDGLDGDFGIRLGIELIALADHLVAKFLIVLDDAVMYAYDVIVIYDVGVCVILRGFAVGCPSCVADAACALERCAAVCLLGKDLEPALGLYDNRICFSDEKDSNTFTVSGIGIRNSRMSGKPGGYINDPGCRHSDRDRKSA